MKLHRLVHCGVGLSWVGLIAHAQTWVKPPLSSLVLGWSPDVHSRLITLAFPDETLDCILAMQRGSSTTDRIEYQGAEHTYMHAMRSPQLSAEEAAQKMYTFIEENFALARYARDRDESCFFRGVALHPVMDATSPAHQGFQLWDPIDISNLQGVIRALLSPRSLPKKLHAMSRHGNWAHTMTLENADALFAHPEILEATLQTMQNVHRIQFVLLKEIQN